MVRSLVEADAPLSKLLTEVGAYFNSQDVLEHTWTTSTLAQVDLAISKVGWLELPPEADVSRHIPDGEDARGFPKFRYAGGTGMAEAGFGELEKTISANGGYGEKKWDGLMLNKVGRMNERRRGCPGGHFDMRRQRMANAAALARGDPLPHPNLPQLSPRSNAEYVSRYFCGSAGQLVHTHGGLIWHPK